MNDIRRLAAELVHAAADTVPLWRDFAIAGLALVVIGCILAFLAAWQATE